MSRSYFGTDGIRGEANTPPLTAPFVQRLGQVLGARLLTQSARPSVVIGRDTRLSGPMLESALVSGLTSVGVEALLVGELPTPGIAYLTRALGAASGVVISASHNPFHDNGIKLFGPDGFKLADADEHALEQALDAGEVTAAIGTAIGRVSTVPDATDRYVDHLGEAVPSGFSLSHVRVVVDCANGAAWRAAPALLERLGARVTCIGDEPDGTNINDGCGSLDIEALRGAVVASGADVGLALDGDADRAILVDADGRVVDGDAVLALCAIEMARTGQLAQRTVVATVMSNMGLEHALRGHGITMERTAVGDRYVVQRMREGGFNFGGEQSGHLLFLDHSTTGDGLLAALQVMKVVEQTGRPLAELASVLERFPQVLHSVRVRAKPPLPGLRAVGAAIEAVEARLGDEGRVLVRYSGTEPKLRVMVEGRDAVAIDAAAREILAAFDAEVGLAEEVRP